MTLTLRAAILGLFGLTSSLAMACTGTPTPSPDVASADAVVSDGAASDTVVADTAADTAVVCSETTSCASRAECCSGFPNCTGMTVRRCTSSRGASSTVPADLCTAGQDCIGGFCGSTTSGTASEFRCTQACLPAGGFCADADSCCGHTCTSGVCS